LSGGEKSRLALALLVRQRPNLVLLDEPTNHLDLEMRHALMRALTGYEGSLVLVSHDRALLRTVCDSFVLVADGRAAEFDGDVADYLTWLDKRRSRPAGPDVTRDTQRAARRSTRDQTDAQRQQQLAARRPLLRTTQRLEGEIARLEDERRALETQLADPGFYERDAAAAERASRRCGELATLINAAEERWLAAQAELDRLDAS
jgi:ATP-binding cassette subfamily F protein 3